jgi:hypothetical protein
VKFPDDWKAQLRAIQPKTTLATLATMLELTEGQLYANRVASEEFDNECVRISGGRAKSLYHETPKAEGPRQSQLPSNWLTRMSRIQCRLRVAEIAHILNISEADLCALRRVNQELDNRCLAVHISKAKRPLFRPERASLIEENIDVRTPMPLIDRENLSHECRISVLSIMGLTSSTMREELTLSEVRRWGALLALCFDVIAEQKLELRKTRTQLNDAKVALHNKTRGTLSPNHSSNGAGSQTTL